MLSEHIYRRPAEIPLYLSAPEREEERKRAGGDERESNGEGDMQTPGEINLETAPGCFKTRLSKCSPSAHIRSERETERDNIEI